MHIIDDLPRDRGSKYAVSGGPARSKAEALAFIRALTREKRFAKATHNSWALLIEEEGQPVPLKSDDGESGAGAIILRMLEAAGRHNHIVVVTRWYGGTKLGGDRFRHVQDATRRYLDDTAP